MVDRQSGKTASKTPDGGMPSMSSGNHEPPSPQHRPQVRAGDTSPSGRANPSPTMRLHFDHDSNSGWDDKFEINHSAYRLRESKCFISSGEAMTCTTCHDPHRNPGDERSSRQFDAACLTCHQARLSKLESVGIHPAASGCAGCHMPKRRTDDVVQAVMTDHLIQAVPPNGLLEPKREKSTLAETAYRGEVTLYYPESPLDSTDELYIALAQIAQGSNRDQGIAHLRSALQRQKPAEAGFYFNLAVALEESGRLDESVHWFEQALVRDPGFGLARTRLGSVLSQAGNHREAQRGAEAGHGNGTGRSEESQGEGGSTLPAVDVRGICGISPGGHKARSLPP